MQLKKSTEILFAMKVMRITFSGLRRREYPDLLRPVVDGKAFLIRANGKASV
jgi:hypothetical protein